MTLVPGYGRRTMAVALAMLALLAVGLYGCNGKTESTEGKTLHAKQVLERYDADQQPVAQYLEMWVAPPMAVCHEMDAGGKVLSISLDNADGHIQYDAETMEARKSGAAAVFHVNFQRLKNAYAKATAQGELTYAGRDCIAWLLESNDEDDWVKAYVDQQTGWVLLCDAPLFRLRTASVELLGADAKRFETPAGLKFSEGGQR